MTRDCPSEPEVNSPQLQGQRQAELPHIDLQSVNSIAKNGGLRTIRWGSSAAFPGAKGD